VYSTCLYCHTSLGRNDAVEHFPVGRRLAFDTANGRFWVICPSCKRWNLSPLEERWDAMEECERLFERTRLRMSTDNIGLARIAEGTELVRVGPALRPEMAAWRFGAQLAARRREYRWVIAGGVVLAGGLMIGVKTAGLSLIGGNWAWQMVKGGYERATRLVLPVPRSVATGMRPPSRAGSPARLGLGAAAMSPPRIETKHARDAQIVMDHADDRLRLSLSVVGGTKLHYGGADLASVAPKILARVNRSGGRREDERLAVAMLERVADSRPPELFRGVVDQYASGITKTVPLGKIGGSIRLALEMALQEQRERELLAGELLDLEFAWKEAEELARIADTLESSEVDLALARLKARMGG